MNLHIVFDQFPQLSTKRLHLRPITPNDREAIFATFSQASVIRYYDVPQFTSIEEADKLINVFVHRYEARTAIRWGIALKTRPEWLIGSIGYNVFDQHAQFAEIGYELHPNAWGQGIGAEAAAAAIKFGFDQIGLHRIEANVFAKNTASSKLLKKLGFLHEGTLREREFWLGERLDLEWYGLLKKNYQE